MSLKELASLAPWNWDPQAAKHPPKRAALQDFEKIESAWRHDDTGKNLAPAPTPRERRRPSAACNSTELGWETPSASGLARKAASADRARSLLKRKAADLQTPDSQKQPALQQPALQQPALQQPALQQPAARSRTRERGQDPDAVSNAAIHTTSEPSNMGCTFKEHGQQQPFTGPPVLEATARHADGKDKDDSCGAADASKRANKISWVERNESTPLASQTPAQTHRDLSMQPPRWTPLAVCGSAAQPESFPAVGGAPRSPILQHGIAAADGSMLSCSGGVQLLPSSALVQQLPAEKCIAQRDEHRAERSDSRATATPGQAARCRPTGSIPFGGGPRPQLAAEPAAAADTTPDSPGAVAGWTIPEAENRVAPFVGNGADRGGSTSGTAELSTHGLCSRSRDGGGGMHPGVRLAPSTIVAAKNLEDLTAHTSQPGVHRRGGSQPRSDGGTTATALENRINAEERTPYGCKIGEGSLMSPAASQHPPTAHTITSLPQLQLPSSSPGQGRLGDFTPSRARGQHQHLRPSDQLSSLCTGNNGSKALRAIAAGVGTASSGVAACLSEPTVTPTTQICVLVEDAIAKATQLQPQKNSSPAGWGRTMQPPAGPTLLPGGTTQGDAQGLSSEAARSLSPRVALRERQGSAVAKVVGMPGVLQDPVAAMPHEAVLPTAIAEVSSEKAGGNGSTGPGTRGIGLGAAPCRDQTNALPRSPLVARQGSHVAGFGPSATGEIGEAATGKSVPRLGSSAPAGVWGLGQQGAAANRAATTGLQAANRSTAVALARAKAPRIMTSSTTGISGSENFGQGHDSNCEALSKGSLQNPAPSCEGGEAALEALFPAAIAAERSKPVLKLIRETNAVTAMAHGSQNSAVLLSSVRRQLGDEQEEADADKVIDKRAPAEERLLQKAIAKKADRNNALAASTSQGKVMSSTMAMATDPRQDPPPRFETQVATFRLPEQLSATTHCGLTGASASNPARCTGASDEPAGGAVNGGATTAAGCTDGMTAPSRNASEPTLPPVALTQQQLMVLDQLLAFFRANGCRHPSAMSAAELVAAISNFCQSAGIPVVASNIQTLASWLGTLMALEKPVRAYAQAQARARAQQPAESSDFGSEPQLQQDQIERQPQQQQQAVSLPHASGVEPGDAVLSHGSQREGGETDDGQRPEECITQLGGSASGPCQKRVVSGTRSRTESPPPPPQHQHQHLGPQGPFRCPHLGEKGLQPQREQPLQEHRLCFEATGTSRDGIAAELDSHRAGKTAADAGQDPLPILPLQPGRPMGPTSLDALSSEWSSHLSPAVTALYDRLTSCQQALRRALLSSATGPTLLPPSGGAPQQQSLMGFAATPRAPAATSQLPQPEGECVPMAPAAGLVSSGLDVQPWSRAQHPTTYPQSVITQQLQRLIARQHKQQQQALGAVAFQSGLTAPREGATAAAEGATATSAAGKAWPAVAQPSVPGAGTQSWTQTQRTHLDNQALSAVPDSACIEHMSSSGGGADPSAATAGITAVRAGHQKDPRRVRTTEPPSPAMQQAVSFHNAAVVAATATGAPAPDCRSTQPHHMQTVALVTETFAQSSINAMPAVPIAGWSARSSQQQHWTVSRATAGGVAPGGAAAGATAAASAQRPMQPPARSQVQGAGHAAASPHAAAAATLSASTKWSAGGSDVAAAAAALGARLAQTPRVKYGAAVGTTAPVPTLTASQAATAAASPYQAYDVSGARSLQFTPAVPQVAASSTPVLYPRASGISPAEDASVLQPSPVQPAAVTGHAAAAVPYARTLRPYSYPSAATGHAWHYANPYGWYNGAGRAISVAEHPEPFAYPYTARGAAVPYVRAVPGIAGGSIVQGSMSLAARDFAGPAQGSIGPPGLESVQQQEHLGFGKAKPTHRRVKSVGLGWNMHGYAPAAGQPYGHVPAGSYPAALQGGRGWSGGS
ncbi:hypothetical protein VaNZ11_000319 [Volvox africanus]|uniref:Uncharacterized protein n=1 Tax=Volvox africanus TaxID=51714 RepID=A0ABQ5RLV2_9CHLO|nr:hypothetical protein VaNZ11_000319 [Volvox africanus]